MAPKDPLYAGLGTDGAALMRDILADYVAVDCEPDAREIALIRAAAQVRDRLTQLQTSIDQEGLTLPAAGGATKPNPALAESRQHAVALSRLLAGIVIGDAQGKSARHVRAAQARWSRANGA